MRRMLVILLAGTLLLTLVAPASVAGKKRKERTAEATYLGGAPGGLVVSGTPCLTECARFEVRSGERYVSLHLADAAGQPVYASVYVHGYTDGTDPHEHICGETSTALPLTRGLKELVIVVETSGVGVGCPGPPTSGTIHATFSNIP